VCIYIVEGKQSGWEELACGKEDNADIMAFLYGGQHKAFSTVSDHLHLSSEEVHLFFFKKLFLTAEGHKEAFKNTDIANLRWHSSASGGRGLFSPVDVLACCMPKAEALTITQFQLCLLPPWLLTKSGGCATTFKSKKNLRHLQYTVLGIHILFNPIASIFIIRVSVWSASFG